MFVGPRQVHDEVILEGPEESAEQALKETVRCMEQPWDGVGLRELRVRRGPLAGILIGAVQVAGFRCFRLDSVAYAFWGWD